LSRRGFIGAAAALGLAGASFAKPSVAAPAATLIDTHHHFFPPAYQKAWLEWEDARRAPHFPSQVAWSKSKAIEEMDEAGIRNRGVVDRIDPRGLVRSRCREGQPNGP
jgi:hypothetical protein